MSGRSTLGWLARSNIPVTEDDVTPVPEACTTAISDGTAAPAPSVRSNCEAAGRFVSRTESGPVPRPKAAGVSCFVQPLALAGGNGKCMFRPRRCSTPRELRPHASPPPALSASSPSPGPSSDIAGIAPLSGWASHPSLWSLGGRCPEPHRRPTPRPTSVFITAPRKPNRRAPRLPRPPHHPPLGSRPAPRDIPLHPAGPDRYHEAGPRCAPRTATGAFRRASGP